MDIKVFINEMLGIKKKEISNNEIKRIRHKVMQKYADPLYFKWQRGECEKKDWLDEVEKIRKKFPYNEE